MNIPFLTSSIPALGGEIKQTPEDFYVEEIPSYLPCGEGQHIYLTIKKQNLTTDDAIKILRRAFKVREKDIGKAGIKDKLATTIQTLSVDIGAKTSFSEVQKIVDGITEFEVLKISRHKNKLKTGHLLGNKFIVKIRGITPDKAAIDQIAAMIKKGLPNFYGPQRFGSHGDNHLQALRILKGEKELNHQMTKLLMSSLQSKIFNDYLTIRMNAGHLYTKFDDDENRDVIIHDIVTGPMFGEKLLRPRGIPFQMEEEALKQNSITLDELHHEFLQGSRRDVVLTVENLQYELDGDCLTLSFVLPKGGYATSVSREFSKSS